jgi:hypothetical protein
MSFQEWLDTRLKLSKSIAFLCCSKEVCGTTSACCVAEVHAVIHMAMFSAHDRRSVEHCGIMLPAITTLDD